ncbi:hypothetical protein S83_038480 [Arachis hypogaea]|nr:Pre-rRNA-processing protein like [Arachis hypogaea]
MLVLLWCSWAVFTKNSKKKRKRVKQRSHTHTRRLLRRRPSLLQCLSRLLSLEKSSGWFDLFVCRVPSRRMEGAKRLQGNSFSVFSEGIRLVLFRWSIFLDAVKNDILTERLYIDFAQCSG